MSDFGDRLKEAMKKKGLNASELSKLSGVGKNLISYYINGKYLAKQDKVFMLAKALNVNPGWLMTGVEQVDDPEKRIAIVVPNSQRFVELVKYMPQDEYLMVMEAFERANKRMEKEKENQKND